MVQDIVTVATGLSETMLPTVHHFVKLFMDNLEMLEALDLTDQALSY